MRRFVFFANSVFGSPWTEEGCLDLRHLQLRTSTSNIGTILERRRQSVVFLHIKGSA